MILNSVLDLINSVAADVNHRSEISVLPLMCGTGKSTAISYKIKETIEESPSSGNGLLIVTDRVDRMEDYLHPYDKDLEDFLMDHRDKITIITSENYEKTIDECKQTPVLMMTTQRFFRLSDGEIDDFLHWGERNKNHRPLVLIDERPELSTIVELNEWNITSAIIAINSVFNPSFIAGSSEYEEILTHFKTFFSDVRQSGYSPHKFYCFWSCYDTISEDDRETYDYQFKKVSICREKINAVAGGTYYEDVFTRLKAMRHLSEENGLLSHQTTPKGTSIDSLYVHLDNYGLLNNMKAKCIILDGTAKFSPEYKINNFHVPNEYKDFQRRLEDLTIRIVNVPTTKTNMLQSKKYRDTVMDYVQLYYKEVIERDVGNHSERFALFTYKDLEDPYKKAFGKDRVEHFGNIVGKNDFREACHIIQVGLNRFPDAIYYMYYLAKNPSEYKKYINMNKAYTSVTLTSPSTMEDGYLIENGKPVEEQELQFSDLDIKQIIKQSETIEQQIAAHNGEVISIMNEILLAEIEQNMFRGIIRNSHSKEKYCFHLFINKTRYASLIEMMEKRYHDDLGATVLVENVSLSIPIRKIMQRKEHDYAKTFILWHDTALKINDPYTPTLIREKIGMNKKARVQSYEQMLRNNPVLRLLLNEERDDRKARGAYVKKRNWY